MTKGFFFDYEQEKGRFYMLFWFVIKIKELYLCYIIIKEQFLITDFKKKPLKKMGKNDSPGTKEKKEYEYNLAKWLNSQTTAHKNTAKKAMALSLGISVRMLESYIYKRKGQRGPKLGEERKKLLATITGLKIDEI